MNCRYCGRELTRRQSQLKQRYCSKACWYSKGFGSPSARDAILAERACVVCQKAFRPKTRLRAEKQQACSRACAFRHMQACRRVGSACRICNRDTADAKLRRRYGAICRPCFNARRREYQNARYANDEAYRNRARTVARNAARKRTRTNRQQPFNEWAEITAETLARQGMPTEFIEIACEAVRKALPYRDAYRRTLGHAGNLADLRED